MANNNSYRYSFQTRTGYLLLSMFSGLLETGIFTILAINQSLLWGLAGALAYQLGCLARNPLRLTPRASVTLLAIAVVMNFINIVMTSNKMWLSLIMVVLVSAGIQAAREWLLCEQPTVPVWLKRLFRVAGFTIGIVIAITPNITPLIFASVITILSIIILLACGNGRIPRQTWQGINSNWNPGYMGWVMLTHQIHYFAYAYVLLYVLLRINTAYPFLQVQNALFGALLFAVGWGTYIGGEFVLKTWFKITPRSAIIYGHCWIVLWLSCLITHLDNIYIVSVSWVLAGFGGGSVYAIKTVAKKMSCKADLELWEHIGHVVGVLLALVFTAIIPLILQAPFILAILAASVVAIRLKLSYRNGHKYAYSS